MGKMPEGLLKWREKQGRGAIMKPTTFKKIESKAKASGATNPAAVAGKAYWGAAKSKFSGAKKILRGK